MQKINQRYRLALLMRHLVRDKVDDLTLAIIVEGTAGRVRLEDSSARASLRKIPFSCVFAKIKGYLS